MSIGWYANRHQGPTLEIVNGLQHLCCCLGAADGLQALCHLRDQRRRTVALVGQDQVGGLKEGAGAHHRSGPN